MNQTTNHALSELAKLHGVQTSYQDVEGRHRAASTEALIAVLQSLGIPIGKPDDAADLLNLGRLNVWRARLPPVLVVWEGESTVIQLRLPRFEVKGRAQCELVLEDGTERKWSVDPVHLPVMLEEKMDGVDYVGLYLDLMAVGLSPGYHKFSITLGGVTSSTVIFSAPRFVYRPEYVGNELSWGIFAPVYALSNKRNYGAGDLTDLHELMEFGMPLGADTFAILPILSTFLDRNGIYAHSPYMPVSRLFWNEMYLDPSLSAEIDNCPEAAALMESQAFRDEALKLQQAELIDHGAVMALKRKILSLLSDALFAGKGSRRDLFERFAAERPRLKDYAAFRAACERYSMPWSSWAPEEKGGKLKEEDYSSSPYRYHCYVQWLMHEQLGLLSETARRKAGEGGLYLDLPVGVHRDGYDTWSERDAFALSASAGAPPDPFFTKGQEWGFPPLDPAGSRAQGHRYFIESIRNHLEYAGILRIDHVMGLHRLFWVPQGYPASEGVYVRYPAKELYAVLCIESYRAQARIIGENLGTVPEYVNEEMDRRRVQKMYVGQFSMSTNPAEGLLPPDEGDLAAMNTHDMPTFAAFWRGNDIEDRKKLDLLTDEQARGEHEMREYQRISILEWLRAGGFMNGDCMEEAGILSEEEKRVFSIFSGLQKKLADSDAECVLLTLEDLWMESLSQNIPGTYLEHPNWQRRMKYSLEDLQNKKYITDFLLDIDRRRKRQTE